ncbi:hypothetical protein GO001_25280 [Streptomyces sp. NRRL B-1677]|uniref:Uncharacterized protein n=1 Tax=Streptomyces klenkii TaxID=1420899 RepID=A0A3B0BXN1_9ACTN|nr:MULTISPECIES: hypothetical protein [Streptomyces]MBF6048481.1 hypothetical protein [Streptomyces sp. NRRL B-1677]RKN77630.1 hypothetical protein D7231_02710 [Streptomyces klenkii]
MPDTANSLTDQYTAQVTADIERVSKEREQVRSEISALQQRLETLEADHQQLLKLQVTLTGEPVATVQPSPSDAAVEPEADKKPDAKVPRPRSSQPPAPARAGRRGTKAARGEVTWGEIVSSYLAGQQGPQSVAEITNGVSAAHPARTVQATVVRNTLEALVARGKAQRSKQGRSVNYSVTRERDGAGRPGQKQASVASPEEGDATLS